MRFFKKEALLWSASSPAAGGVVDLSSAKEIQETLHEERDMPGLLARSQEEGGNKAEDVAPPRASIRGEDGLKTLQQVEQSAVKRTHQLIERDLVLVDFCEYIYTCCGICPSPFSDQVQKITASDGALQDQFGSTMALDGGTLAVGSPQDDDGGFNSGAVYVYTSNNGGASISLQAKLRPSDGSDNEFGAAVDISDDVLIAGSAIGDGGAHIFVRTGTSWSQQQKLTADDISGFIALYGSTVSASGNTAAVGAPLDSTLTSSQGSVYVYSRGAHSGTTWDLEQKIVAGDGESGDFFGFAVSLDEDTDTLMVGAPSDDGSVGSVYFYTRSGTTWTFQQKLKANDPTANYGYGNRVTLKGNTAVVGAPSHAGSGAVYVLTRNGSWTQQARLKSTDTPSGADFGISMDLSDDGDKLVAGAYLENDGFSFNAGAAYLFSRTGSAWSQEKVFKADDASTGDQLGLSVAVEGDAVVAGAPLDDDRGDGSGSVYVFDAGA